MNKNLITIASLVLTAIATTAQTNINPAKTWIEVGAYNASAISADVNNDGYCDLILGGVGNGITNEQGNNDWERYRMTHVLLYYPSAKNWQIANYYGDTSADLGLNVSVADRPSLSVCDINRDGILDIVAFESTALHAADQPLLDHISREGIFLGLGDGTFTQAVLHFVDAEGKAVDFDERHILAADVADFNNDGLLDIVAIGHQIVGTNYRYYPSANVILLNRGGGTFEVSYYNTDSYLDDYGQKKRAYQLELGQVQAYDFNNDGYVDFFVNAQSNNRSTLGVRIGNSSHYSEIYLNDPAHPGRFRKQYIYSEEREVPFTTISEGGIAIADFNNDGTPDIFYSGWSGNGRENYVWGVYTIRIAADGSLTFEDRGHEGIEEMRNQNTTATQYVAYDWNGNGNFDIINAGWSPTVSTQTAFISTGNGDATFTNDYRVSGYSEGATALADWNGDGILDYIMIGQTDDDTFFTTQNMTRTFAATVNPNGAVSRPEAPVLQQPAVEGNTVTLRWRCPASEKQNVTFEYFVRDNATGTIIAGGNSFVGGNKDGRRKVTQPGNAYNARTVTLTLPKGTYTCGVQTVNARLEGSPFATSDFTVNSNAVAAVSAEMETCNDGMENVEGCSYAGPVIDNDAPDPTVIRGTDGYYYLFSTEVIHNVPIYRSANLIDWRRIGTAFTDATRPSFVSGAAIWAPDIQYVDGKYLLYYSMSKWGGEWECGIGVATATRPQGPYRNAKKLFISSEIGVQNSIDPFFFEEDGHKYLFWGSFRGIYGIELSSDGQSVMEDARPRRIAGTLTEGTYIIKRNGYYYLIGSAGSCCDGANSSYHLVMARSTSLFGPYKDKVGGLATSNQFSNLLYRSADVIAPGHNANFVQDDAGQWWMLYHGYDVMNVDGGRKVYLSQIFWDEDGWPYVRDMKPTLGAPCPLIGEQYTGIETPKLSPDSMGDEHVGVYPQMTRRDITVSHDGDIDFTYQVVNLQGTVITSGKAHGSTTIDLYAKPIGMYIVTVSSATGIHTEKVIRY